MTTEPPSARGPLAGIRVLDFCSFIAGSVTAMLMGDLGADVIEVEPLHGDLSRHWGPFIDGEVEAMDMRPVVEHSAFGRIRVAGVPFHFEWTPGAVQRAAPVLGEHGVEVLREIGCDDDEIAELARQSVVRLPRAAAEGGAGGSGAEGAEEAG